MSDNIERDYGHHHYEGLERRRRRSVSLSDHDIESIANIVAEKVGAHQACRVFTPEEITTIKDILRTKKNVMRVTLFIFTAFAALALRDFWIWLAKSISIVWNGK